MNAKIFHHCLQILLIAAVGMVACGCSGSYTGRTVERPQVEYQIAGVLPEGRSIEGYDRSGPVVSGATLIYMRPWHERYALISVSDLVGTGADLGTPPATSWSKPQEMVDWASQRITTQHIAVASTSFQSVERDHRSGKPGAIFDWDVQYSVLGQPMPNHPDWVVVAVGRSRSPHTRTLETVEHLLLLPATLSPCSGEQIPNVARAAVSLPLAVAFDGFFGACIATGPVGMTIGWVLYPAAEGVLGIPSEGDYQPDHRHWLTPTLQGE